ncbi:MAG: glycosyltransferase [bacterium]|nr:glycosyltransferase [bacterium]
MNILFVCSGKNTVGRISPFIKSQGDSLAARGITVDYFLIKGRGLMGYLSAVPRLRRHLKQNRYDLIHAHYALSGWVAVLALPRPPILVSFMGCDVYGDVTAKGKRTARSNILLCKLLQPFVNAIIVKSRNLADYVYMKKKLHIVPNGVNFQVFKPGDRIDCRRWLGLPITGKLVLFLADVSDPRKNVALLKEALVLLNDPGVKLITPYPVKHKQVADYLSAVDVMVLTSRLEGSPNVVKEAMACNCPVVTTPVGDVEEVLGDTEGCYITSFDAAETARTLREALDFGKHTTGRKAIAHLDETVIAQKITTIYKNLVTPKDTPKDKEKLKLEQWISH